LSSWWSASRRAARQDFVARVFADPLSRALGAPIVVENKTGRRLEHRRGRAWRRPPPTATRSLIASPSSILVNPLLNPNPGFQPLRDLAPVSKVRRVAAGGGQ